jgi:hypothetical protein
MQEVAFMQNEPRRRFEGSKEPEDIRREPQDIRREPEDIRRSGDVHRSPDELRRDEVRRDEVRRDEVRRGGSEPRRIGASREYDWHEFEEYERQRHLRLGRIDQGSRLSWSGLIAGLFVALAVQISLSALGVWAGFGLADVTDLGALADISSAVGIWIAISAVAAIFLAGMVAAWVGGSATVTNGLWHGVVVWGLVITVAVMLSVFGLTGVLGFAATPGQLTDAIPIETLETDVPQAVTTSAEFAGWFLLGAAISLAAALLGGWVGTLNAGKRALTRREKSFDEYEERRAA